jgi:hypothetical protein
MIKRRLFIVVLALIGAVVGAGLAVAATPKSTRYEIEAQVALVPAPDLTMAEASNFWEVLTRGQMTRTAAILYQDWKWLPAAADDAKVPYGSITLTAAALPETTLLTVTVTAGSKDAAKAALTSIMNNATPEVASMVQPYSVKILWPREDAAHLLPGPDSTQLAAGGGLGGLLLGGAVGYFLARWQSRRAERAGTERVETERAEDVENETLLK